MRTITISILLFAAACAAFGQARGLRLGLTGGPGFSEFTSGDDYAKSGGQKMITGYQAGVYGQYDAKSRLSYRFGLLWSHTADYDRGRLYLGEFGDQLFEREYVHEDVMIPVEVVFGFSGKANRFYLSGGLTPAFRAKRRVLETQWWDNGVVNPDRIATDITGQQHYRTVDLFASFGLGYMFRIGERVGLFVQPTLRTNLPGNLINIGKNDFDLPEFRNPTLYTLCLEVGVDLDIRKAPKAGE